MFNIDDVLAKSDLLAYVERAGGQLKGSGNRYSCACPLHGGDNPTAFNVFQKNGKWLWKCWTGDCNNGQEASDAITFVAVWQGFSEGIRDGKRLSIFQQSCEWITGGKIEDAQGMKESAEARHAAALLEEQAAKERTEARRKELEVAERHLYYHQHRTAYHIAEWIKAGIDEGMQEFWKLGGCDDFTYKYEEQTYHTPTLTIPVFGESLELLTIQHRLLNPKNPKDKYRPEITGLHAHPFLALPEMGYDGGIIWVMEGAKKAMVTWTRSNSGWQCIGVPSQEGYKALIETLKPAGSRVIVVPDPNTESNPNAYKKAAHLAHEVGGRVLRVSEKFDDMILSANINENDLFALSKQARKI